MSRDRYFETWQFYAAAIEILRVEWLQKLFQRSRETIYRWAANPMHCGETRANPLDRLRAMFREMRIKGRRDIAVDALAVLADEVRCDVVDQADVVPDCDDLRDECLDDYKPLQAMHDAMRDGAPVPEVELLAQDAHREIDETVAKYRQEQGAAAKEQS